MDSNEAAGLSKRKLRAHLEQLFADVDDDQALLDMLDVLARSNQHFTSLGHLWAPTLYRRDREVFRPFLEQHLWAWQFDFAKGAEWVAELAAAQEVELFRRVYPAKTLQAAWHKREGIWTKDLLSALERADSSARRQNVLRMYDSWWQIPDDVALELYELAPKETAEHLIDSLDKLSEWDEPLEYAKLIAQMKQVGDDNYWPLYRRCVKPAVWRADVERLCEEVLEASEFDEALERHHPTPKAVPNPAEVFTELLERRGEDALAYVLRHVEEFGRDGYSSNSLHWKKLADLTYERAWWGLWREVVARHLNPDAFNALVLRLVEDGASDAGTIRRLMDLSGAKHLNWQMVQPHKLRDDVALALYRHAPQIACGTFREHFIARYDYSLQRSETYEDVAKAAVDRGDEAFIDLLASRNCTPQHFWYVREDPEIYAWYVRYYERLEEQPSRFARRVARVLGHCETLEGSLRSRLAKDNPLYKLFFGDPARFLAAPETVRDLVEASSRQVRELGLLALSVDDPRAHELAEACLDHLLAAPLEDHPRRVHAAVFETLVGLAQREPTLAPVISNRLREVADLLEPPFARPRLVQAIARLLRGTPELRGAQEIPVVYDYCKESA